MGKQITLSSNITVIKVYSGKSKFDFWKNLKVGDVIKISLELESTGSNRGISYTPCVRLKNIMTFENFASSLNDIVKYLGKIDYEC